jgi:hypothetical protein
MDQRIVNALSLIILIILGSYLFYTMHGAPVLAPLETIAGNNPENATYVIAEDPFTLHNGKAEQEAAPESTTKIETSLFGVPVYGDLNGDGVSDGAVMLVRDMGGSGMFYYLAVAIKEPDGYVGTNAILLGDRIAPQNIEIKNGAAIAHYAVRGPNEPMTAQPSVGVSTYAVVTGTTLTEAAPLSEKGDFIKVTSPLPSDAISSPLTIAGEARGTWFFEASFPIILTDWDGKIITQGHATAQSDWMKSDFVPFTATITYTKPTYRNNGFLILKKDNPSGLPQNDDAVEIPILFR